METNNLITAKADIANKLLKDYYVWAKNNGVQEWLGKQTGIGGLSQEWKQ